MSSAGSSRARTGGGAWNERRSESGNKRVAVGHHQQQRQQQHQQAFPPANSGPKQQQQQQQTILRAERSHRTENSRSAPASTSPHADRLYSHAMDVAGRADKFMSTVSCCEDLFKAEFVSLRFRLRQQCEQLILTCPPKWARPAEDILWKKTFYDVISRCKAKTMALPLLGAYRTHLMAAAGYYQQLLAKLLERFSLLQLSGLVDWMALPKNLQHQTGDEENHRVSDDVTRWAVSAAHRCLMYLGDLARYNLEYQPGVELIACRYYHQSICLDPSHGKPHNQLATIALTQKNYCKAAFHYVMGLACGMPFPGMEKNLDSLYRTMASVSKDLNEQMAGGVAESQALSFIQRRFVCRFLAIQEMLGLPASNIQPGDLTLVIRQALEDFEEWLRLLPTGESAPAARSESCGGCLEDLLVVFSAADAALLRDAGDMSLCVIAMAIMMAQRLRQAGSSYTRQVTTFTLSLLAHLVEFCSESLRTSVLLSNESPPSSPSFSPLNAATSSELSPSASTVLQHGSFSGLFIQAGNCFAPTPDDFLNGVGGGSSSSQASRTTGLQFGSSAATPAAGTAAGSGGGMMSLDQAISEAVLDSRRSAEIDARAMHNGGSGAGTGAGSSRHRLPRRRRRPLRRRSRPPHEHNSSSDDEEDSDSSSSELDSYNSSSEMASDDEDSDENTQLNDSGAEDHTFLNGSIDDDSEGGYAGSSGLEHTEGDGEDEGEGSELEPRRRVSASSAGNHGDGQRSRLSSAGGRPMRPIGDELATKSNSTAADTDGASSQSASDLVVSPVSIVHAAASLDMLMAVHVAFDWLCINPAFVASFAKTEDKLWCAVTKLLNFLPRQQRLDKAAARLHINDAAELFSSRHPLPEDVTLLGFSPLAGIQERYDFDWANYTGVLGSGREIMLRLHRMQEFGQVMAENKVLSTFQLSPDKQSFLGPDELAASIKENELEQKAVEEAEASKKRQKLMETMAKRKLQVDVQQLEGSLKKRPNNARPLSPYLVVDAEALLLNLEQIEALARSRRFVIIVPLRVIDTLDDMKTSSTHHAARAAIKRLEEHFKRGSRWVRAQRESETHAPAAAKKPNDPAELRAWRFSRVVDCCIYFVQHANTKSKTSMFRPLSHGLVTLLTGQAILQPRDAALVALDTPLEKAVAEARSAGADVFRVSHFFQLWSQSPAAAASAAGATSAAAGPASAHTQHRPPHGRGSSRAPSRGARHQGNGESSAAGPKRFSSQHHASSAAVATRKTPGESKQRATDAPAGAGGHRTRSGSSSRGRRGSAGAAGRGGGGGGARNSNGYG
ncbi:nonsense-mediated mRNA decay factor SMG5-like [Sycon ciliatum]|uniref:nonsense-mediated mRNA decay factor SMG5-like n=1 Tax=Sycon ciliatum TaxID=27933 RepID=UPI0031F6AF58